MFIYRVTTFVPYLSQDNKFQWHKCM